MHKWHTVEYWKGLLGEDHITCVLWAVSSFQRDNSNAHDDAVQISAQELLACSFIIGYAGQQRSILHASFGCGQLFTSTPNLQLIF